MFFKLILENANGNRIDMTTTANEYMTSNIEGLNPPVQKNHSRRSHEVISQRLSA